MNNGSTVPLAERFWPKVEKTATCWLWRGALSTWGYGRIKGNDRRILQAHRVAYELAVGPIQDGLDLDHLCRVRACVNPAHLEPVTRRVNLLRGETIVAREATATRCTNGHTFDAANTYLTRRGQRHCRACDRDRHRARWNARRAA